MSDEAGTPDSPPEGPPADISKRFGKLFELASRNLTLGLKYWMEEIVPHFDTENNLDDLAERTLERFARLAREKAAPNELYAVEAQIAAARAELLKVRTDSHTRALNAIVRGFQRGIRRNMRHAGLASRTPSIRELQELLILEDTLGAAPPAECLAWIEKGLVHAHAAPLEAHLAFAPLRLFPSERWLEQLAATLMEGIDAQLDVPGRVRDAVVANLSRDGLVSAPIDTSLDRDKWRLLAGLCPAKTIVAEARRYLLWLLGARGVAAADRQATVGAVCVCVDAVSPGSIAQVAFFEWLKRNPALWACEFALLGIRAQRRADEAEGLLPSPDRQSAVARLAATYSDDLEVLAHLENPDGRHLVERVIEEIFGRETRGSQSSAALLMEIAATKPSAAKIFVQLPAPVAVLSHAPLRELVGA